MGKNTSISLDPHFDGFIAQQIEGENSGVADCSLTSVLDELDTGHS